MGNMMGNLAKSLGLAKEDIVEQLLFDAWQYPGLWGLLHLESCLFPKVSSSVLAFLARLNRWDIPVVRETVNDLPREAHSVWISL